MHKLLKSSLVLTLVSLMCLPAISSEKYRFIGEATIPNYTVFNNTQIGGLSGIVYNDNTEQLLSISDDSLASPARIYKFDFVLNQNSFSIKPTDVILLKDRNQKNFATGQIDFEDLHIVGDKIIAVSEGNRASKKLVDPEIYVYSNNGQFLNLLPVPLFYIQESENSNSGARLNLSFESISGSKDGKTLFISNEESLIQDGLISSTQKGGTVRITRYSNYTPKASYAYELEPVSEQNIAGVDVSTIVNGDNGLVAIAYINENTFYTLERSYLPTLRKNVIRVFKASINPTTTNILNVDSIQGKEINKISKELVVDFSTFMNELKGKKLDNFESMTFGPKLANGNQTLIFVSDNNFSPVQRTLFIALELLP